MLPMVVSKLATPAKIASFCPSPARSWGAVELLAEGHNQPTPLPPHLTEKLKRVNKSRSISDFVGCFMSKTISVTETDVLFTQKCCDWVWRDVCWITWPLHLIGREIEISWEHLTFNYQLSWWSVCPEMFQLSLIRYLLKYMTFQACLTDKTIEMSKSVKRQIWVSRAVLIRNYFHCINATCLPKNVAHALATIFAEAQNPPTISNRQIIQSDQMVLRLNSWNRRTSNPFRLLAWKIINVRAMQKIWTLKSKHFIQSDNSTKMYFKTLHETWI